MKNIFCSSNLGVASKLFIKSAGIAVALNNPTLATTAIPVAKGVLEAIEKGINNETINAELKDMLSVLIKKVSDNKLIRAELMLALDELKIDVSGEVPKFNLFSNDEIKDMVSAFMAGLTVGAAAT